MTVQQRINQTRKKEVPGTLNARALRSRGAGARWGLAAWILLLCLCMSGAVFAAENTVSISGTVQWADALQEGGETTLYLLADGLRVYGTDGSAVRLTVREEDKGQTARCAATLTDGRIDRWTAETRPAQDESGYTWVFENLPKYTDGQEIHYTVEAEHDEGFDAAYAEGPHGVFTILLTRRTGAASVQARVVWANEKDGKSLRPRKVRLQLNKKLLDEAGAPVLNENGRETLIAISGRTATLTAARAAQGDPSVWQYTFKNLPRYENGREIQYAVTAEPFFGYSANAYADAKDQYTLTYTRAEARRIQLRESVLEPGDAADGKLSYYMALAWDDGTNQDGIRPVAATVTVYKTTNDGTLTALNNVKGEPITVKVTKDDDWFTSLDMNEALVEGLSLTAKVTSVTLENGEEVAVQGDEFSVTGGEEADYALYEYNIIPPDIKYRTFYLIYAHEPEVIDYPIVKVWRDENNRDGVRPEYVTVQLYANDEAQGDELNLTGNETDMRWSYTYKNLPRYQNGQEIVYSVKETAVEGYEWVNTARSKGWYDETRRVYTSWYDRDGKYIRETEQAQLVNQHNPEKTSFTVEKVWADVSDRDGARPTSVTLTLFADGVSTGQTIVLDGVKDTGLTAIDPGEKEPWKATFSDLYKYRAGGVGEAITYTVQETAMSTNGIRWTKARDGLTWTSEAFETPYISSGEANAKNGYRITNTHEPATTGVQIVKVWADDENAAGIRPKTLDIELLKNGESFRTVTLTEEGGWTQTLRGLYKYENGQLIEYTWKEPEIKGYAEQSREAKTEGNVDVTTITNGLGTDTGNLVILITFEGTPEGADLEGLQLQVTGPDEYTLNLTYADFLGTATSRSYTEAGLAAGKYTVSEINADTLIPGYQLNGEESILTAEAEVIPGGEDAIAVLNNVYSAANGSLVVTKTFTGLGDNDDPSLLAFTVTGPNDYTQSFTYAEFENGAYLLEGLVPGDYLVYETNADSLFENKTLRSDSITAVRAQVAVDQTAEVSLINNYDAATTGLTVIKIWDDQKNVDGLRPETLKVTLNANGEPAFTLELSEEGNWTGLITNLPLTDESGKTIEYTWAEEEVPGYESQQVTGGRVTVFTNTHTPEGPKTTSATVVKRWEDNNNSDGMRPASIQAVLYQNGEAIETLTLSEENGWTAQVDGLPTMLGDVPAEYTWAEEIDEESGYYLSRREVSGNVTTLTNAYKSETVTLQVKKIWEDGENRDGLRPTELDVTLLADGEPVQLLTLTRGKDWTLTVPELPRYNNGEAIQYTFEESEKGLPEGYSLFSQEGEGDMTTIVNAYQWETVEVPVTKVWKDQNAKEGVRPENVTVYLLADGEVCDAHILSAGEEDTDTWTYVFDDLPKRNEQGEEITYTVQELVTPQYETEMIGDMESGFVITNTYSSTGSVQLTAVKQVSGEEPMDVDDIFSFELYTAEADAETLKLESVSESPMAMVNNDLSNITFPEIAYNLSEANQTYWFVISEVIPEGSLSYEYDFTRFAAAVTVTDNGDGTLNAETKWYKVDEDNQALVAAEAAVFNNLRAMPSALTVTKTVVGNATTRHFDFTATFRDENGEILTGVYPYKIQDGDGKVTEEGNVELDQEGALTFRLMDGEMMVIDALPLGATYTVRETIVKAYIISTQDNGETNVVTGTIVEGGAHVDFINTEVTTDFTVRKVWQGGDPGWSINLVLGTVDDGEFLPLAPPQPPYTREGNNYFFKDLPKYDEMDYLIVYAVKEQPITGYGMIKYTNKNSNASEYALNDGTVTNSKTTEFRVKKVWTGVKEGEELPEVTLALWQVNGNSYQLFRTVKTKLKNEQWYTFNMLPEGYTYYVTEDTPEGFAVSYDNGSTSDVTDRANNFGTIINHKIPKTGDNDPVELWTLMALTGLAGLALLAVLRKKAWQQ